ncbi:MAG: GH39 family glycosyl hydrolase [Promethearchaeota archaeon]
MKLAGYKKQIIIIFSILGFIGGGIYSYYELAPLNYVSINVDLNKDYINYDTGSPLTVNPVYDTLNIWDISWFNQSTNDPIAYKSKYYFIDKLVVMTATGGRDTGSNEYMTINENGSISYNFSALDIMVDWLKNASITPVFVIGNTPHALTPDPDNIDYGAFGADTAEPNNYTLYSYYICNLTSHLLNYAGHDFISNWTWRIYTEPDNDDWLNGTLDTYFRIYTTTARAIRSVLPDAKLELGNMMDKDFDERHKNFIDKLANEAKDVFPNVIGWSVYGKIRKDLFMKEAFDLIQQWQNYISKLGFKNIEYVIEEGQILVDEDKRRLWLGDSTELGAAFTANAFTQCLYHNLSRYTTWDFYSCEIRTPKLNLIDMFRKMQNEEIKSISFTYPKLIKNTRHTINGLAARTSDSDNSNGTYKKSHVLLYNLVNNRNYNHSVKINLKIKHLDPQYSHLKMYFIDKNWSNFHRDWDPYAFKNNFTYCVVPGYGMGSPFDVALGMTLCEEFRNDYYLWSWNHHLTDYQLETIVNTSLSLNTTLSSPLKLPSPNPIGAYIQNITQIIEDNNRFCSIEMKFYLNSNNVLLIEFD